MSKIVSCVALLLFSASAALADGLTEGFDNISNLPADGWVIVNNSSQPGETSWFQGNTAAFSSQNGAADSYIAANFENAAFGANISNWLITPEMSLANGTTITFYTRTEFAAPAPDYLELRMSTNGASSDVGSTDSSVGDFTTLLLAINFPLNAPDQWTQYTLTVTGLGGPTDGRLAFRYAITDTSINGDYIGIDTLSVAPPIATPEPATISLVLLGAFAFGSRKLVHRRKNSGI